MLFRCFLTISAAILLLGAEPAAPAGPLRAEGDADQKAQIKAIRLVGDEARTRLIVDVDRQTGFGLLRLRNPYRLVVDLRHTNIGFEPDPAEARGLVTDYRYGMVGPGRARIVLDLEGPVNVVQSFMMESADGQPARLVLDMAPGTAEDFARATAQQGQTQSAGVGRKGDKLTGRRLSSKPVVVIDPGHGGIDTGAAIARDVVEKDLTLAFAKKLAAILNERGHVDVILTRTEDVFMSLGNRVKTARLNEASLFVSVHADVVQQDYVRGATVYTVSDEASDELAERMAERENRSDVLAGLSIDDEPDEVADILFDLARRETKNLSIRFARELIRDIRAKLTLNKSPWRRASFLVLRAPDVPSVLFELGYISNEKDQELLTSPEWQEETARLTAGAIERFLAPDKALPRTAKGD